MSQRLRLGLLMNSYELSFWEYVLVERLMNSHYASIELLVLSDDNSVKRCSIEGRGGTWEHIVYALYCKFDQKLFNVKPNAFESRDATDLLHGIPTIRAKAISGKCSDRFQNEDILKIKHHNLDVLIRLGFRILRGDILRSAKYGVWSYHHGDTNVHRGTPAGFWEVIERWDVTGSVLQILTEDLGAGRVLFRSYFSTDKHSVHKNRNSLYWKSLSFIPRKLEELYNVGEVKFFDRVDKQNKYPSFFSNRLLSSKDLNNWKMFKLIAVHLLRFMRDECVHLIYFDQWILMFSIGKGLSTSLWRFKKIIPPKDRSFADPFIIQKENVYYIYFEEFVYRTKKGHISVIEMDEKGNYKRPVKVIDRSYHLAYPFIFKNKDDYFLIPDSRSNKTIELYKCVEFPFRWEFQMNLMENVEAADTTLFYHRNKWWLFASIIENHTVCRSEELFLFYSEDLHTRAWISHPLNPVVSDVRKSRSAGSIFIHNGKIMRPSQNCSRRYGYGFKLSEIRILDETEYEEIEIGSAEPNWENEIMATHTLNNAGNLTVIDGILRRKRYF